MALASPMAAAVCGKGGEAHKSTGGGWDQPL